MLDAMPIPKKDVDELMSSIRTAVLQMRLSGKSRAGVSGVVMFFAICLRIALRAPVVSPGMKAQRAKHAVQACLDFGYIS